MRRKSNFSRAIFKEHLINFFKAALMGSAGMKRSTRAFGDRVLRSGRRMFASRYRESKRVRLISIVVVETEENKGKLLDYGMEIDIEERKETKSGKSKKVNGNGEKQEGIELGESNEMSLVNDDHDYGENLSPIKQFGAVYTRKRKRDVGTDSSLRGCSFDVSHGTDKMYEKKYFRKKVRASLKSGFYGKHVLRKRPIVFAVPCSYKNDDGKSSVHLFSCFVRSMLRYLKITKLFSWRRFYSFVLLESAASKYLSSGVLFSQDSICTMSHRFFKVFGVVNSIPFFTMNYDSLPSCFLYIYSSLLLKFAFLSYASQIHHPVDENVTSYDVKMPSISTIQRGQHIDKAVNSKRARSTRKRVPRVSLFSKVSHKNDQGHVEDIVPVPGVREIEGYAEEGYVPFKLPESYISSRSDEISRTLEKSYPVYDMDSDDEQWLKNFKTEQASEDTFENVIDAFERGIYCSPHDYSDAASAADRCGELASKEVLEAVYSYWMTKRKKKRSPLIRVYQCYKRKRVIQHVTNPVLRKKRSFRRQASLRFAEKQLGSKKEILNDAKMEEEAANASLKVHETQEAARRSEAAAIAKRREAQALMANADLAAYRAAIALRIAEAAAASASQTSGATLDDLGD